MDEDASRMKFVRARGLRFPADPALVSRRRRMLLKNNAYDRKLTDAALRNIVPADRVIELGAGLGYTSALVAAKLGVRRVLAFEANARLIPHIRAAHAANGIETVEVVNAALGPRQGRADFFVRGDFAASSLFDDQGDGHGGVIAVDRVDMLDARAAFARCAPSVLICDIVGAEAEFLEEADLSDLRLAVIALHPQGLGASGVHRVFDAMGRAGLVYYPRTSDGKVVTFRRDW